ncbi:MAG: hypothetical protein LQ350_003604 [Teloschistes chrysophthalmus]|nr:MAG: hypothetical protein LQ350_003604 [Niorma chrysophthalma]
MASIGNLNILTVSFNCGRQFIHPEIFGRHLYNAFPGSHSPDIIVLCLQEVAPIAYSFLGGSYLVPYFVLFHNAVSLAAQVRGEVHYEHVITRNVGMTACMLFVSREHRRCVQWVETAGVGLGVHEMGNKGAVGFRWGYAAAEEVMELTVVATHLAPMEDALKRRNEDWMNLVRGLVFTPVDNHKEPRASQRGETLNEESKALLADHQDKKSKGIYTPTSHLILAGDLNYRTSDTAPLPSDTLAYPQPASSPTDPHHYSHLLEKDQLSRERKAGRTFQGLTEAPIAFPPTYKYSKKAQLRAGSDASMREWEWAKHRWPSWCDRILWLDFPVWFKTESLNDTTIEVEKYDALPLNPTSDHRPVVLGLRVPLKAIPTPKDGEGEDDPRLNPPFAIDPKWRERRMTARRKEVLVGLFAYLVLTWEGLVILLALLVGAFGGWAIVRSMLEV